MANNDLKTTNEILVKVDQNNLIYIDPNSILDNGEVKPRGVEPENYIMFVNLEADLVPRSVLINNDTKSTLISVAKGTLNFMRNANGRDYDTTWTDAYFERKATSLSNDATYYTNDETTQSFGIDSVSIQVRGANFIPRVVMRFVDVRGKTLFESPEHSPYSAFFHLPWPLFYLTVKGYYGKAIRYRLHMIKFNARYNSSTGNFDIECNFVGSTYAYLADIPMDAVLNAPYFYATENKISETYNEKTKQTDVLISKTTKGYRVLKSVYQEYISKGLLPPDFPVKTLREIISVAGELEKILEREIFPKVIHHRVLGAIKDYEDKLRFLVEGCDTWRKMNLVTASPITTTKTRENVFTGESEFIPYYTLNSTDKGSLTNITGDQVGSIALILSRAIDELEQNLAFGIYRDETILKGEEIQPKIISCSSIKRLSDFYIISNGIVGFDFDGLMMRIDDIRKDYVEQRNQIEIEIERKMNDFVSSKRDPKIGIGFVPTVRNITGVLLANAETFLRLMKDVHFKAFERAEDRKKILNSVLTDTDNRNNAIYPWPEVKVQNYGNKSMVLLYPGDKSISNKLQSYDATLWPEVDFIENFYAIATSQKDNLGGKENSPDNINYIFDTSLNMKNYNLSVLTDIINMMPYTDKSIGSIIYELYERAKYTTLFTPYNDKAVLELAEIEYQNLKNQLGEDIDVVDVLKRNITSFSKLIQELETLSYRYPYYEDQIPSVEYIKNATEKDYTIQKHTGKSGAFSKTKTYPEVKNFLENYKAENYRKSIYPFNSPLYLSYLGQTTYESNNLDLNMLLTINEPTDFITSYSSGHMWVKDNKPECGKNLFLNTIDLKVSDTITIEKHILNTPYFHNQLYKEFINNESSGKYVGSAYLLLNSLPFKDLDDRITYAGGGTSTLVSTLIKELPATHYIPYHMILKWGSIYHRYKKWIIDSVDIIGNVTDSIDGGNFFDQNNGYTFNTGISEKPMINRATQSDVGCHPLYETIFYQIVNGQSFLNIDDIVDDYYRMITSGVTRLSYREVHGGNAWTSVIDNQKLYPSLSGYTLLPTNGYINVNASDFNMSEQDNFRIIWNVNDSERSLVDYTQFTFPSPYEYFNLTGDSSYSLSTNYKKVLDLIAVFKPNILEQFELAFLDFASEKLNEEIPFNPYKTPYSKFQDLLKEIVTIDNILPSEFEQATTTNNNKFMGFMKIKQNEKLNNLTNTLLGNDCLIKLALSNPREIDPHVFGGFTNTDVMRFDSGSFNVNQVTLENLNYIRLYLGLNGITGEENDDYYLDFFSVNDIELNEENIKRFRPLIYLYAGLRSNGMTGLTNSNFVTYVKDNIVVPPPVTIGVDRFQGPTERMVMFLEYIIRKIQSSDFGTRIEVEDSSIVRGYNDDPTLKLELYNLFKSFNDKWTSGNSIGQRTLMEEFLFLDKANRDIGSQVFLDMSKLLRLNRPENKKINLYGAISLLFQDTGFDIRALPAYVNFYGTNFNNNSKLLPSKTVAQNMFGIFTDIDYQDSSPRIILQYVGPNSKHLELSDLYKYKSEYKNDGFYIADTHNNPIIVASEVFNRTDFGKSNKCVAFEVSFGDQNQSIFKTVEVDQSSIKNTSESFEVLDRLGKSESGASAAQVDIGLWDIYRQSSYQCTVTCMGNVMIQPTMFFYLKNVPLFRGSYWITEVNHEIKTSGIETSFTGTRIPQESLPDPKDSFMASYRSLFDRLVNKALVKIKDDERLSEPGITKNITTAEGTFTSSVDNIIIQGEKQVIRVGYTSYGIPYNGYKKEIDEDIQLVVYGGSEWLRVRVVEMGGKNYPIDDNIDMSIISSLTTPIVNTPRIVKWNELKERTKVDDFYVTRFDRNLISDNTIVSNFKNTEFLRPKQRNLTSDKTFTLITNIIMESGNGVYNGPVSVGPPKLKGGYGIGMSWSLMKKLDLWDGDVVYFRMR